MKTFKGKCIMILLLTLAPFINIFMISNTVFADMCCYVAPVEVILKSGIGINGFLIMYGNEIRGYENKEGPVMKTVSFGMNMPSTPERVWVGVDYAFDTIEISNAAVTMKIKNNLYTIYRVNYFFTDNGLPFSSKYSRDEKGYLRHEIKAIPMTELKLIRRTGEILSIPAYYD